MLSLELLLFLLCQSRAVPVLPPMHQDSRFLRFSGVFTLNLLLQSLLELLQLSRALAVDEFHPLFTLVLRNLLVEVAQPKHDA